MCGKQATEGIVTIEFGINAFDDPRTKKNLCANILLDQIIIEYNSEILKNLTNLGLSYKAAFMYSDLNPATGPSKLNKKKTLQRMIELQAPLYSLRKILLQKSMGKNIDNSIKKYHKQFLANIEKQKPHSQKQRELKDKQIETINKIKKIDKTLIDLNFDVAVCLRHIYFGLAGEKDDYLTSNKTLLELDVENQNITL